MKAEYWLLSILFSGGCFFHNQRANRIGEMMDKYSVCNGAVVDSFEEGAALVEVAGELYLYYPKHPIKEGEALPISEAYELCRELILTGKLTVVRSPK